MRLSTIKLSGFKSFVDPTILYLPTNMTGVVGPNGCGKSNIIDAIRWVMGESIASRLRGDVLTDVIFSGSTERSPVSQAIVELIFDNSDHTITGEYAAFDEISIKRVVARDGASDYYLNGGKCRRYDVTSLFLGTGLGPRSYSIIEQGMISRVIEAESQDLRVYLEEAAGISKYRARRRETEVRIKRTRDNLDRLNDLREEIGKQSKHLKNQAAQAQKYVVLQETHRTKNVEWKALQYRTLDADLEKMRVKITQHETMLESVIAEQREVERKIVTDRTQRAHVESVLGKAQASVYEVGNHLTRIEQQVTHQHDLDARLQQSRNETTVILTRLSTDMCGDQDTLEALRAAIEIGMPQLQQLRSEIEKHQHVLNDAETKLSAWQSNLEQHISAQFDAARTGDNERTRAAYLDQQLINMKQHLEQLFHEHESLDISAFKTAIADIEQQYESAKNTISEINAVVKNCQAEVANAQVDYLHTQKKRDESRAQLHEKRGRLASLDALQGAALGQEQGAAVQWLQQHGLALAPRVGEALTIEPGWENAVESALGQLVEGVLIDQPKRFIEKLDTLQEGRLVLIASDQNTETVAVSDSLADKVQGSAVIIAMLSHIQVAETLVDAHKLLPHLDEGCGVMTRAGEYLSANMVQVLRFKSVQQGALLREAEIQRSRRDIEQFQGIENALNQELSVQHNAVVMTEKNHENIQNRLHTARHRVSKLAGELEVGKGRLGTVKERFKTIETEVTNVYRKAAWTPRGS